MGNVSDESVVIRMDFWGNPVYIKPGTVTQKGIFGSVQHYQEGDCLHGSDTLGVEHTEYVTRDGKPSPSSTPNSTPNSSPTVALVHGDTPPPLALSTKNK